MSISEPFIRRPVATTLLSIGLLLAGIVAFRQLPLSALPEVDFPTIVVSTQLPGASVEVAGRALRGADGREELVDLALEMTAFG